MRLRKLSLHAQSSSRKMNHQKSKAIDLILEDLHTVHPEIRCRAKGQGCEYELEVVKRQLIDYLNFLRKTP